MITKGVRPRLLGIESFETAGQATSDSRMGPDAGFFGDLGNGLLGRVANTWASWTSAPMPFFPAQALPAGTYFNPGTASAADPRNGGYEATPPDADEISI